VQRLSSCAWHEADGDQPGQYPRAPELRRKTNLTPAEQFWIVKHGVKMTGMPAWGVTHDDDLL
jgi:hypothetical protein